MDPYLVLVTLPGSGERTTQTCSGTVIVGRGDDADLRLSHPLVSRRHAEIEPQEPGRYRVSDLGSRNGTLVDGVPLHDGPVVVGGGSVVQVGPYLLTLLGAETSDDTVVLATSDASRRLVLDRSLRRVHVDREVAIHRLSAQEFTLLRTLDDHHPGALATQVLGDEVWGAGRWDAYMLHNLVRRVRRKFEEQGREGDQLLITVPGVGYRLA